MTTIDHRLAYRLHHVVVEAVLAGDVHKADRWVVSMTRPELEALRTHMLTLRELLDARIEELAMRDGEYRQDEPA